MSVSLSALLKASTATAHEQAESSSFVGEMLEGRLDASAVAALTAQLYVLYRDMEAVAKAHYSADPLLGGFLDPALDRTAALEADMAYHFGRDWRSRLDEGSIVVVPEAHAYAAAIRERHSAEMLLANHYVRYLGDLSGGQIIHRLVQRHYGIPDDGLNFYLFPGLENLKRYKDAYRARLDALVLTEGTEESLLQHASEAFEQNRRVFEGLGNGQWNRS